MLSYYKKFPAFFILLKHTIHAIRIIIIKVWPPLLHIDHIVNKIRKQIITMMKQINKQKRQTDVAQTDSQDLCC